MKFNFYRDSLEAFLKLNQNGVYTKFVNNYI